MTHLYRRFLRIQHDLCLLTCVSNKANDPFSVGEICPLEQELVLRKTEFLRIDMKRAIKRMEVLVGLLYLEVPFHLVECFKVLRILREMLFQIFALDSFLQVFLTVE